MKAFYPKYYDAFHCTASQCPDSCCKDWAVDVDEDAAAFYRALPGSLGDRLRQVLQDTADGAVMIIEDGRCPMWQSDGLCRIHAQLGHEALCHTCRTFPRLTHDYGDFVEYGLELSCPEAARLILTQDPCWLEKDVPGGEDPEYDTAAMELLQDTRKTAMDFLASTPLPPNRALAVLLLYGHEVQSALDGGEAPILDPEQLNALAEKFAAEGDWNSFLRFFQNLEILTSQWQTRLSSPSAEASWHQGFVPLAQYFLTRYWLQAVSDYDLIGRVKLAVASCLVIFRLAGNFLETAQLFSKEIENDPENVEAILDGVYTHSALTDRNLFSLLLS